MTGIMLKVISKAVKLAINKYIFCCGCVLAFFPPAGFQGFSSLALVRRFSLYSLSSVLHT